MSDEIKLGRHKLAERNAFVEAKTTQYLKKHPEVKRQKARKYAKVKWARKLQKEEDGRKHKNQIRITK